ncbi:ankyrin repeat domain-containing protein [Taklimakanibacter deserti]|uniref:ankyrin repeat domain-containing protein n=1 Tax=Taklimakanibacter deserti TaxID=2267839 RepID=UPI0013C48DDC
MAGPVAADDLTAAIKARDSEQVQALLRGGADSNRSSSYGGPINLAAALGPPEIVVALLDAGADPQMPGFGGMSPLHTAALSGQPAITRILVQRGAQVDALDNLGRTALLVYASGAAHNLDVLQILLKAGANPNAAERTTNISVLHYIAQQGEVEEAELLVAAGANLNARDNLFGQTPLHHANACCNGAIGAIVNHEMVRFLIAHGADMNAEDINGRTPLFYVRKCSPNASLLIDIMSKAGAH